LLADSSFDMPFDMPLARIDGAQILVGKLASGVTNT
jgi:hypothetical protein